MQSPDVIRINFATNPAAAEAFNDAKIGEKGKAEIRYTFKSRDATGIDLILEAIVPEGYEVSENDEPGSMAPMSEDDDNTMTPTSMMVRKMRSSKS